MSVIDLNAPFAVHSYTPTVILFILNILFIICFLFSIVILALSRTQTLLAEFKPPISQMQAKS